MSKSQDKIQRVKKRVAFTGIDPGLEGAIVTVAGTLYADGRVVLDGDHQLDRTPIIKREKHDKRMKYEVMEMLKTVRQHRLAAEVITVGHATVPTRTTGIHRVVLERAQVRPTERRTVSAQAAVGQAIWEAVLQWSGLDYKPLWPTVWKRWAGLIGTEKSEVRQKAAELNDKWLGGTMRSCSDIFNHDGLADAFVMAIYAFCHATGDE